MNPFPVHRPTLPTQHHVDPQVAEARPCLSDLPYPVAQGGLIPCLALAVPRATRERRQIAGTGYRHAEATVDPAGYLPPLGRLQSFFRTTSPRMCLSSVRSATSRFRRAFSSRS